MRFSPLVLGVAALVGLAACSAPAPSTSSPGSSGGSVYAPPPDGAPTYGPGTLCADTYVIVSPDNARTNFSLGSENYRNDDFCAAYPYLKWLIANDPLFTGAEERDDRNFLRMAGVYEYFAANVDSTNDALRRAYIDSSLAARAAGRAAMDAAGITYDSYARDLREGFTYFSNAGLYDDAEERQFEAFSRAFEAQPDSLEDWYIQQLFNASAAHYGDDVAGRAAYINNLARYVDDTGTRSYFTGFATYLTTEPATGDPVASSDTAVQDLLARVADGTICGNGETTLLATVLQQPERIEALGGNTDAIQSTLVRCPQITAQVDNPRTLLALAFVEYRSGNSGRGNELFQRAIANAGSNSQRADFYYARYARTRSASDISEALRYNPNHGPSLFTRAGFIGDAVGRRSDLQGRFAYWCLADIYRSVAATASDSRIAAAARRAAAQYDRAGPTREQYFLAGYRPGQTVSSSLGSYGSCSTRVR